MRRSRGYNREESKQGDTYHEDSAISDFDAIELAINENSPHIETLIHFTERRVFNMYQNGSTILHIAAADSSIDICKRILARTDNKNCMNNDGLGAIHIAALNDREDLCRSLCEGGCNPMLKTTAEFVTDDDKTIPTGSTIHNILDIINGEGIRQAQAVTTNSAHRAIR